MTSEEYNPRPNGRFVTFAAQPGGPPAAPYTWPQDTLRIPHGFGAMPLVNDLNANRSRREFFGMSANWNGPAFDTVNTQVLPVPKDGDFWCSAIAVQTIYPGAASPDQAPLSGVVAYLGIQDANTGYSLTPEFYDDSGQLIQGAPWASFETRQFTLAASLSPFTYPFGGGTRTDILQPYCFLRGGGIRVVLRIPPNGGQFPNFMPNPLNFYLSLVGWKEYAYAAA